MRTTGVHRLESPGSGCGDIRLTYRETYLVLDYEFRASGRDYVGHLRFEDVVAFRFRDELHSAGFADASYDEVVDIQDSEWLEQLSVIEPAGFGALRSRRHFAVLLSNNGYLEVVALRVTIVLPTVGLLGGDGVSEGK
jgi:hypothetical protein